MWLLVRGKADCGHPLGMSKQTTVSDTRLRLPLYTVGVGENVGSSCPGMPGFDTGVGTGNRASLRANGSTGSSPRGDRRRTAHLWWSDVRDGGKDVQMCRRYRPEIYALPD